MSKQAPAKNAEVQPYQRENLIKLQSWVDREIRVSFSGGRQITGILKGYDNSNNMLVDDTIEYIRDKNDHYKLTKEKRTLGLIFLRGTMVNI